MKNNIYLFLLFILVSCSTENSENHTSGEALGTTYSIIYFTDKDFPVDEGLDSIFEAVNRSMSTYREGSDISRINSGETGVQVDAMFQEVYKLSQKVHDESKGYFDPTVGDLVNMYGFGPEKGLKIIDSSTVDSLMEFVGFEKVRISEAGTLIKTSPEVYLDFNAIAKGYTIDVIGKYLQEKGIENFLIELGGELLAKGKNIGKDAFWTVGIDDPQQVEGERTLKIAISLENRAMATSGNYRKFRTDSLTGRKFVHSINPFTGYPEESNLLGVTVLAQNCALADAYATTFMVMGLDKTKELLGNLEKVDAYLIYSQPDGSVTEYLSPGFEKLVVQEF